MEDLITGAETFANYLRFQLFKKNNQMFRKDVYIHNTDVDWFHLKEYKS